MWPCAISYITVNETFESHVFPCGPAFIDLAFRVSGVLERHDNHVHTLSYIVSKAFNKHS